MFAFAIKFHHLRWGPHVILRNLGLGQKRWVRESDRYIMKTIATADAPTTPLVSPETFHKHLLYCQHFAWDSLREFGKLESVIVGYNDLEMILFPAETATQEERNKLYSSVRAAFHLAGVNHYVYMAEAWFSQNQSSQALVPKPPEADPDRQEGVLIIGVAPKITSSYLMPTIRDSQGAFRGLDQSIKLDNPGEIPTDLLMDPSEELPEEVLQLALQFIQNHGSVKAFSSHAA